MIIAGYDAILDQSDQQNLYNHLSNYTNSHYLEVKHGLPSYEMQCLFWLCTIVMEIGIEIILHTLAVILDSKNLIDNLYNVIVFFFWVVLQNVWVGKTMVISAYNSSSSAVRGVSLWTREVPYPGKIWLWFLSVIYWWFRVGTNCFMFSCICDINWTCFYRCSTRGSINWSINLNAAKYHRRAGGLWWIKKPFPWSARLVNWSW